MFCLYLRGQSTFWGYFFTVGALSYRPFGFWCDFCPKWPFWGLASMEVGWPQKSWDLIKWHKSASHAKFDHYRTSGSWVMSDLSRKLQMHVPLYWLIYDWDGIVFDSTAWYSLFFHLVALVLKVSMIITRVAELLSLYCKHDRFNYIDYCHHWTRLGRFYIQTKILV